MYGCPDAEGKEAITAPWGKGYASEATWAHIHGYIKHLIEKDKESGTKYFYTQDKTQPLQGVEASARIDNPASVAVLLKSGMHSVFEPQIVRDWPHARYTFFASQESILRASVLRKPTTQPNIENLSLQ